MVTVLIIPNIPQTDEIAYLPNRPVFLLWNVPSVHMYTNHVLLSAPGLESHHNPVLPALQYIHNTLLPD